MAPRALWKGYLKLDALVCPVALYAAASTAERMAFHTLNAKTGNRVRREYVDGDTGKPVEADAQVKGYEAGGRMVILTPEEIAEATPESDKTLAVEAFIACSEVDTVYFDKPYFLAPADKEGATAFALIREGLKAKKAAAVARAVLFRRVRALMIRPDGDGLVANTLNFDYEIRSAEDAFSRIPEIKTKGEMLDLAMHIIKTKTGRFDPAAVTDRYDDALKDLVKAKAEGRAIKAPPKKPEAKVVDLMEALRQSAKAAGAKKATKAAPAPRRKAG